VRTPSVNAGTRSTGAEASSTAGLSTEQDVRTSEWLAKKVSKIFSYLGTLPHATAVT